MKTSPGVEVLRLESPSVEEFLDPLCGAIAHARLRGLHLARADEPLGEHAIQALIGALRLNSSLCMFSVAGATQAQMDEIHKLVDANRMPPAARLAMGHGFATRPS